MAPTRITEDISRERRAFLDARNKQAKELREAKRLKGETAESIRMKLVKQCVDKALGVVKQRARDRARRALYVSQNKEKIAAASKLKHVSDKGARLSGPAATDERGIYSAVAKVATGAISHAKAMANQRTRAKSFAKSNRGSINSRKRERRKTDEHFLAVSRLRCRLANTVRVKGVKKRAKTGELYGCSCEQLVAHLKSQLPVGSKLNDYEIDHIFPMARYKLDTLDDQKRCMNWTNLHPLTKSDNQSKKAKLPSKRMARKVKRDCWPIGVTEEDLLD